MSTARRAPSPVAVTNVDLEQANREKTFRADAYDRLNEIVREVPSLRERPGDLPLLVPDLYETRGRASLASARTESDRRRVPAHVIRGS